jgi:ATP-binding cassette subfamily B protein
MEEEVLGKAYDGRLMRRLLGYMRPYRRLVAASLVFLLAQSVLETLGPLLTKIAVDKYLAPGGQRAGWFLDPLLPADPWAGLGRIALLYLGVLLGSFVCEFAQTYLMQYTGQLAMFDLRRQLMERLQRLDLAFYDRNPVGRIVTRVTTDVDVLNDLFASGLVTILGDLMALSFVFAIMLSLSPALTGILLCAMPFVLAATVLFRRRVQESYRRIRVAIAKINSYLQEHVTGIAVVQLFNRERRSAQEFDRANREHMLAFKDAITAYGWFYPVVEFLSMLALAACASRADGSPWG